MPERIAISLAEPGDRAAILALHREAGWPGTHLDGEVWGRAHLADEVVGSAQLIELASGIVLVDAAVVRADARGRGIGTALLRTVLATREAEWWLECREERIAFYERLGFVVIDDVPRLVAERVGSNAVRRQHFLRSCTGADCLFGV